VKTAIAGEDPNWGRVVMAVGKAGEPPSATSSRSGSGRISVASRMASDTDLFEDGVAAVHAEPEIDIKVDIGLGRGKATIWTCDLTKEYVAINGDYRS
jgi:glutamate N-acetyltransferase/amino-acid N-acetyltransferase